MNDKTNVCIEDWLPGQLHAAWLFVLQNLYGVMTSFTFEYHFYSELSLFVGDYSTITSSLPFFFPLQPPI